MPVLLEFTAVTFLPGRDNPGSGVAWVDLHTLPTSVEVLTISEVVKRLNANPAWSDGFREYDQFCPMSTRLAAVRLQSGASLQVKSKLPFGEGAFAASNGFVTYHAAGMAPAVEHMARILANPVDELRQLVTDAAAQRIHDAGKKVTARVRT